MLQIAQRARKRAGLVFGAIQPGRLEAFSRVKNNLNGLTTLGFPALKHIHFHSLIFFNTPFAPSAPVLTLERVFNPGAENHSFRLCARHVTLPETSRGATVG